MVLTWPPKERSFPISIEASPVTQTAEVEVKSASTKVRGPLEAEKGNQSRRVPNRMTPAKPRMKILSGERDLESRGLILTCFFIGINLLKEKYR